MNVDLTRMAMERLIELAVYKARLMEFKIDMMAPEIPMSRYFNFIEMYGFVRVSQSGLFMSQSSYKLRI